MAFPDFRKLNLWYIAALAIMSLLFIASPYGKEFQVFLFGNPCEAGYIYNQSFKQCLPSGTNLSCGTGSYLQYVDEKYSCQLSNFSLALLLIVVLFAIYFYTRNKAAVAWRPAKECFKRAYNGGHLKTDWVADGSGDWIRAWQRVAEPHMIRSLEAWLFIGDFVRPGVMHSVLITGTDDKGWVIDQWKTKMEFPDVEKLKKQGIKLEEALQEVYAAQARTSKAVQSFNSTQEGLT